MRKIKNLDFFLILSLLVAAILRFQNLGYSDYQGDEIKALYLPENGSNFFGFLFDQRKGPIQFFITFLLKFLNSDYTNELLIRLPFALAGFLSVYFFYKTFKELFSKKIAFYATMFFVTNGFLIAFSRIVQYQSFVILFMVMTLYYFTQALTKETYRIKGIYFGFICWALSILSHYDGVFIAPFAFLLLYRWYKLQTPESTESAITNKVKLRHLAISLVISGLMLAAFYIPFIVTLSEETLGYWEGRISGDVSGKISSSTYLFTVYQPIYVIHIYYLLSALSLVFILIKTVSRFWPNKILKHVNVLNQPFYLIIGLLIWFLIPFLFMEKFVYIPGTHIYTYLIPLFIIMALGIYSAEEIAKKVFIRPIKLVMFALCFGILYTFLALQSYAVFVENKTEYPWTYEKFLIWTFPQPTPIFHLSMFGFPYYRNWEGIKSFVQEHPEITAYTSNERKSISRHYVTVERDGDNAGFYIYISNPQSNTEEILSEKALYWSNKYEPVYTYSRNGDALVRIYIMKPGKLKDIIQEGF